MPARFPRARRAATFDPASAPDTSADDSADDSSAGSASGSDPSSDESSGAGTSVSSGHHAASHPAAANSTSFAPANATVPASVHFSLDVTPPVACQPVNITFAPIGLPPYHITVALSNQYTYSFEIPHNYAPLDRGLWNYEWTVPLIHDNTTSMVVALTDANGAMANTSRIQTVRSPPTLPPGCPQPALPADFYFYSSGAPLQCERWRLVYQSTKETTTELGANLTNGHASPPFTVHYYPEQRPPISYEIPIDRWSPHNLNGTATVLLPMRASTAFLYSMSDSGPYPQGGVSLRNVMGLDENYLNDSCIDVDIPGYGHQIPRPSATVAPMSLAGLPERYVTTTFSYKSVGSSTSSPIAAIQTVVEGYPLPGYKWGPPGSLAPGHPDSSSDLSGGQIAGVVVAVVGCAVLVMMAVVIGRCVARKRRRDGGVTAWDLPEPESDKRASQLYSQAPITQGIFTGRTAYFPAPSETSTDVINTREGTGDDPNVTGVVMTADTSLASTAYDAPPPLSTVCRSRSGSTSAPSVHTPPTELALANAAEPTTLRPQVPGSPVVRGPSSSAGTSTLRNDASLGPLGTDANLAERPQSLNSMPMRARMSNPPMGLEMGTVSSDHTQVRVRQHLDAGVVLMDDNEAGEVVDLPPQYESLSAAYAPIPYDSSTGHAPYPTYAPFYPTHSYTTYSYYAGDQHAHLGPSETPYRATEAYTGPPAQFHPLNRPPPVISPEHPLPFPRSGPGPNSAFTSVPPGNSLQISRLGTTGSDASRPLVPPSAPSRSRMIVSDSLIPLSPPPPEPTFPLAPISPSPETEAEPAAEAAPEPGSGPNAGASDSGAPPPNGGSGHPLSSSTSLAASSPAPSASGLWLDRAPTPPPALPRRRYFAFVAEGQELGPHDTLADELPNSHRNSIWTDETRQSDSTSP